MLTEPGAVVGEMSVLLDQPHTATVRAVSDSVVYEFDDAAAFLRDQPAVALLIARLLAQRLNVANTYLADIMQQYAGHGDHLAMVGEVLQSMINLPPTRSRQARIGNPTQGCEPPRRLGDSSSRPLQRRVEIDALCVAGR